MLGHCPVAGAAVAAPCPLHFLEAGDTSAASDLGAATGRPAPSVADSLAVAEASSSGLAAREAVLDTLPIAELVRLRLGLRVNDSVPTADSPASRVALLDLAADVLVVAEDQHSGLTFLEEVAEALVVSELVRIGLRLRGADTLTASDAEGVRMTSQPAVLDLLAAVEFAIAFGGWGDPIRGGRVWTGAPESFGAWSPVTQPASAWLPVSTPSGAWTPTS